jgi:hypothetical protein
MRATVRWLSLVALVLALPAIGLSCGGGDTGQPDAAKKKRDASVPTDLDATADDGQDGGTGTGRDASAAAGLDAAMRPDAAAPVGLDAATCTPTCYSDWDCTQTCPPPSQQPGSNCCNKTNGTCFVMAQASCTQPAGPDASTTATCPPVCTYDYECQSACPAPTYGTNCCDSSTNSCYVYASSDCPAGMDAGGVGPY